MWKELCPTSVVFAVVGDHEHDFPFEDVALDQTAAYARDGFFLHGFELAAEEAGGGGWTTHLVRKCWGGVGRFVSTWEDEG